MKLDKDAIKHIAKLSALEISYEEIETFSDELSRTLDFVEKLSELDTENIQPTFQPHAEVNAFRKDEVGDSLDLKELENMAPDFNRAGFCVPKIIKA